MDRPWTGGAWRRIINSHSKMKSVDQSKLRGSNPPKPRGMDLDLGGVPPFPAFHVMQNADDSVTVCAKPHVLF